MKTQQIPTDEFFAALEKALAGRGALLVVKNPAGGANPMTIGWAMQGFVWQKHILQVLVRPSRFTHELLAKTDRFSVCVPGDDLNKALSFCGSKSGRDMDKAAACGLTLLPGEMPDTFVSPDCEFFCECKTLATMQMDGNTLFATAAVESSFYRQGDFHSMYYGEILRSYRSVR